MSPNVVEANFVELALYCDQVADGRLLNLFIEDAVAVSVCNVVLVGTPLIARLSSNRWSSRHSSILLWRNRKKSNENLRLETPMCT